MNLRNGQISVREILQNPQARGLIQREVPQLAGMLNSPMAVAWQGMTLNAVAAQAQRFIHIIQRMDFIAALAHHTLFCFSQCHKIIFCLAVPAQKVI